MKQVHLRRKYDTQECRTGSSIERVGLSGEPAMIVWNAVVDDMILRNEFGQLKYNRYLQEDCPDDMLQHAYEEALDLAVYLKTKIIQEKMNVG